MDNQTIRNTFRELRKDQKMVLFCEEDYRYTLYSDDIISMESGNDLQIQKGLLSREDSRGILPTRSERTIYIDCSFVISITVMDSEEEF
ncbi:hypothetical protein [Methanobrevibacter intestini]|uniref:hypothetical protein n=1 Tax=Methanobrevibacter intestini TaxID=2911853 RepID=UPI003D002402